jgi:two-component system nitrogen regulation response regulator NtrX
LRSTLEKLFVLVRSAIVRPEDVVSLMKAEGPHNRVDEESGFGLQDYREARRQWEREYLTRKLREFGGNVTRTAAAIGLERQSLQEKIRTLDVARP